jgi:hypothetical protein
MKLNRSLWSALGMASALSPGPAWAYIDPGTGSMLVQSLLAIVAGALVAGRLYWRKLKRFFSRRKGDGADR